MNEELPANIVKAAYAMAEAAGHDPEEWGQWEGNAHHCHRWMMYVHQARMIEAALPFLIERALEP